MEARLSSEGLDRDAIDECARALWSFTESRTIAEGLFERVAKAKVADDPLAFARSLLTRATTLKKDAGVAREPGDADAVRMTAGIRVLETALLAGRTELAECLLELALLHGYRLQAPAISIVFGGNEETAVSRAIRSLSSPNSELAYAGVRTIETYLDPVAKREEVLPRRLETVLDGIESSKRGPLPAIIPILRNAFARLWDLAGPDASRERAPRSRSKAPSPTRSGPPYARRALPCHLSRVRRTRRCARPRGHGARATSVPSNDARRFLNLLLGDGEGNDADRLTQRIEAIMARISALAEEARAKAKATAKQHSMRSAQIEGERAKKALAELIREVVTAPWARLCEIADWSNDRTALLLALSPEPLLKEGIKEIAFPTQHVDDLFRVDRPIPRAAQLAYHSNSAISTRAAEVIAERKVSLDLSDMLFLRHRSTRSDVVDAAEIDQRFIPVEVAKMLDDATLSARELAERLDLASTQWLAKPKGSRRRLVTDAILPAYERLVELANVCDARQLAALFELPLRFHATEAEVHFPPRHAEGSSTALGSTWVEHSSSLATRTRSCATRLRGSSIASTSDVRAIAKAF